MEVLLVVGFLVAWIVYDTKKQRAIEDYKSHLEREEWKRKNKVE